MAAFVVKSSGLALGWPNMMQIVNYEGMRVPEAIGHRLRPLQMWVIRWQVGMRMYHVASGCLRPVEACKDDGGG